MISMLELRTRNQVSAAVGEDRLKALRDAAISLWETATDGLWTEALRVERVRVPRRKRTIRLQARPLTALTQVRVRTSESADWTILVGDVDFERDDDATSALRRIGQEWEELVEVTYTGGYTDSTSPLIVREALAIQVAFMIERDDSSRVAVRDASILDSQTSYLRAEMHPRFRSLARSHRRIA